VPLTDELTELLRDMRHEAGLTQSELGKRLGWYIDQRRYDRCANISRYEHGRRNPGLVLIGRWAAACGFDAELVVTHPDGGRWSIPLNGETDR
jgi:transcriptional regulator with XRE-family HTH domain